MGKRKRSRSKDSDYDSILRKVRKLQSKLRKRRRLSSSASESVESDRSYNRYYDTHGYEQDANLPEQEVLHDVVYVYDDPQPGASAGGDDEPVAGPSTSSAAPASAPVTALASAPPDVGAENVEAPHPNDAIELDPEIIQLLGTDLANQKNYGDMLHKDIASRWAYILAHGLSKDTQVELMNIYLPPENCPIMRALKLNLEIKAALLHINIKKDFFSQNKQNQLGCGLAAIGRVLNWALSPESLVPQDIIKSLSDAGRLICDSHYKESQSRRYAALSTLNKNIKDTVKNTNIDEQLFGSDLSEHIKSSKAITKTGSEIKLKTQRPMYRTSAITQPRGALNSRGAPPRIAPAVEPRSTPAPRRPPRDRRLETTRGRRLANSGRYQARKRY